MHTDVKEILVSEEQIQEAVKRIARDLDTHYQDKKPLVIGILKGSVIFMADLVRAMEIDIELDFMDVSSYGAGVESSGQVKIIKDLDAPIEGRHVLIVEDIIDTGQTLAYLMGMLSQRGASSVKVATLLDKPERRVNNLKPTWTGIEIPNEFVIGYGLDFDEQYRNLPYIGILKEEVYQ